MNEHTDKASTAQGGGSTATAAAPAEVQPGRDIVLEPLPRGTWQVILGVVVAALAPLGGFLVGSMIGVGDPDAPVNPMFLSLFIGIVIGGVGAAAALLGGIRLYKAHHHD